MRDLNGLSAREGGGKPGYLSETLLSAARRSVGIMPLYDTPWEQGKRSYKPN